MTDENLYEALDLDTDAAPDEVTKAYKKKAQQTHPDKGGDAEKFQIVKKAYEVLSDPERRKNYDETGQVDPPAVDPMLNELAAILHDKVLNGNLDFNNIVDEVRQELRTRIKQGEAANKRLDKEIEKFGKAKKRIKFKKAENNLAGMLEGFIKQARESKESNLKIVARWERMIVMLEDYDYEVDDPETAGEWMSRNHWPS